VILNFINTVKMFTFVRYEGESSVITSLRYTLLQAKVTDHPSHITGDIREDKE